MGFFAKKRTVQSPLVCLFCPEVNPLWFSKENADAIPICTACHLQLAPASFKEVVISGVCSDSIDVDRATALAAAMSAMTILWASINSKDKSVVANSPVSWDVWNPETYDQWPVISQQVFLETFGDGACLESETLGNLAEQIPFLASMSSNFLWRVHESPDETSVTLWPKESLAVVSRDNFSAIKTYLASVRPSINVLEIWKLIDRLLELIEQNPGTLSANKLFGFDVVVHSFSGLALHAADEIRTQEDFSSNELMQLRPGSSLDPFGRDVAKRLYTKSDPHSDFEMLGPFDLLVKIMDAGKYPLGPQSSQEGLRLVHEFSFKVLVAAENISVAARFVRENFFDKFGFVVQRNSQNWLVDKKHGVDYFGYISDDVRESQLYSKVVEVRPSSPDDWKGTAWQLRCS